MTSIRCVSYVISISYSIASKVCTQDISKRANIDDIL